MGQDVDASCLGDEWKGYTLRITGGNDKQGFPMKQGVLTNGRVRLLLKKGHSCFRERRAGQKKRKSVRGCIVDANLSVLSMIIVKKGETVSNPEITKCNVKCRVESEKRVKSRNSSSLYMANLQEIPGLTDDTKPRRLGPKRASKIRKLFMLSKEDDVRQYVIKRPLPAKVC